MPVATERVTVGTSATRLFEASAARRDFHIYNDGSEAIYLGGPSVTATDGIPVNPGATFWLQQAHPTDGSVRYPWYAVAAGGDVVVRILGVKG